MVTTESSTSRTILAERVAVTRDGRSFCWSRCPACGGEVHYRTYPRTNGPEPRGKCVAGCGDLGWLSDIDETIADRIEAAMAEREAAA